MLQSPGDLFCRPHDLVRIWIVEPSSVGGMVTHIGYLDPSAQSQTISKIVQHTEASLMSEARRHHLCCGCTTTGATAVDPQDPGSAVCDACCMRRTAVAGAYFVNRVFRFSMKGITLEC